jgi:hypothetical protein
MTATSFSQRRLTRQTLRDWVIRYNAEGIEGLHDRPKGHAQRALTPEQEQQLEELVLRGPEGTLVRWRRVDLPLSNSEWLPLPSARPQGRIPCSAGKPFLAPAMHKVQAAARRTGQGCEAPPKAACP